jgi:hypothetical protein
VLCHLQVRAEATVRCAGLQRAQVAPRQEMPNLEAPKFSALPRRWLTLGVGASVVGTRAPLVM